MRRIYKRRMSLFMVLILIAQSLVGIAYAEILTENVEKRMEVIYELENVATTTGAATVITAKLENESSDSSIHNLENSKSTVKEELETISLDGEVIDEVVTSEAATVVEVMPTSKQVEVKVRGDREYYILTASDVVMDGDTITRFIGDTSVIGTDIIIPKMINGVAVKKIGSNAFYRKELTGVLIPESVTSIGGNAFADNKLTSVLVSEGVIDIGELAFSRNELTSVLIPESVTRIGEGAFAHNALTSVLIPEGVVSIGGLAFFDNKPMISVEISESVTSIGRLAFSGNALTSVEIPKGVTSIGEGAFSHNALTSVKISESVTRIGELAFFNNKLTSVEIPEGVVSIGESAFSRNVLTSVEIPDHEIDISTDAFQEAFAIDGQLVVKGSQSLNGKYLNDVFDGKKKVDLYHHGGEELYDSDAIAGGTILYWGEYNVRFSYREGSGNYPTIEDRFVRHGVDAIPPTVPPRKDYIFKGWDRDFTNVQSDLIVTAEYGEDSNNNGIEDVEYTVSFEDYNGKVLKTEQVIESNDATPPANPSRENYIFKEWDKPFTNVQSDLTITAVYGEDSNNNGIEDVEYTVSFEDYNGKVLKTEQVIESNDATPPANPSRKNYIFKEWDTPFTNVQSNLTITAVYGEDSNNNGIEDVDYTVNFLDHDGTVLKTQTVIESNDASAPENPSRSGYVFTGWDRTFINVQSNLSVYANFKRDKEAGGTTGGGGSVSHNPSNTSTEQSTANSKAYMIGMPDGTFQPEKYLTRAELISLFDRFYTLEDSYTVSASYNVYADVESDAWYYDAVNRMTQRGLVKGYEDGTFRPDQEVTREELAQVVYNHFELGDCYKREVNSDYYGNCYNDIYGRWSTDALIGLQTRGLLQDFSDGSFTPESPICRGETVLILNRYFGYDSGYNKDFTTTFSDIEFDSKWSLPVALASKDQLIHSSFISELEMEMNLN